MPPFDVCKSQTSCGMLVMGFWVKLKRAKLVICPNSEGTVLSWLLAAAMTVNAFILPSVVGRLVKLLLFTAKFPNPSS